MKKVLFFLLTLAAMLPWAANAQETLTVYDGTNTNSNIPFYGLYADTEGSAAEFVIPSDMLEDMTGGQITAMKFYIATAATAAWTGTHQVYIGEVSTTTLTGITGPSSFTVVRTASFDATGTELEITFDAPYTYGGGNLLIGTYTSVAGNWKSAYFTGVNQTENTGWYRNNASAGGSGVKFIPKTTFTYTPGTPISCPRPTNVQITYVSDQMAYFTWDDVEGGSWQIANVAAGETPTVWGSTIATNEGGVTGLTGNTQYDFYVRRYCSSTDQSTPVKVNYRTNCGTITTFPWIEDFEGMTANTVPVCWDNTESTSSSLSNYPEYIWGVYSYDGNKMLRMYNYYVQTGTALINSQPIKIPATGSYQLTFDYSNFADCGAFTVNISTDGGENFTQLGSYPQGSTTSQSNPGDFTEAVPISLTAYANQTVILQFLANANYGQGSIFLDNIKIDEIPACAKPTSIHVVSGSLTAHTVTIEWDADEDAMFQALMPAGTFDPDEPPTNWNVQAQTENTANWNSLTPDRDYGVWVRKWCSATEQSEPVYITFHTPVACLIPTGLTATLTSGDGSVADLSWTEEGTATNWVLEYSTTDDFTDATSVNVSGTPAQHITGLTAETTYYARVKADCGSADGQSEWSSTIHFTPTDTYFITVNDGTTTNQYVPVYGLYCDNYSRGQFIIPAEELTAMQNGFINKMTFYSTDENKSWGNASFKVYCGNTGETTLSALAEWNGLEEVYSGSLSISDNQMVITFDNPYQYLGGNLLIGVNQTVTGTYSSCTWYGVAAPEGASMGGYGEGSNINKQNFLPKTTFEYTPGTAPSCMKPTGLAVNYTGGTTAEVSWTSDASAFNIEVNGTVTNNVTNPYTLSGLTLGTVYEVKVQADCGSDGTSDWTNPVSFVTDLCTPTEQCDITFKLTDNYGDGWNGNAIKVVDVLTNVVLGEFANTSAAAANEAQIYNLAACNGREIQFQWIEGTYASETSYTVLGPNGDTIFSGANTMAAPVNYTVNCPACAKPRDLAATPASNSAELSWIGNSANYDVRYRTPEIVDTVFFDGFENGLGNWTTASSDYTSSQTDWGQFNANNFGDEDITNYNGTYVAMSRSYDGSADQSVDNWLITPQVQLDGTLKFWVMDDGQYHEHYDVYVSTTGNSISDFILLYSPGNASSSWSEVTVDLSSYNGANGYIALRHTDEAQDFLLIDDFGIYVSQQAASDWVNATSNTNALTINDLTPETEYEWQVRANCDGEQSDWSASDRFTTTEAVSCLPPTNFEIVSVTDNSASVTWTDPNNLTNPEFVIRYMGGDIDLWGSTNTTAFTFNDLTPNTEFTLEVYTVCSTDETSEAATFTFTTAEGPGVCAIPTNVETTSLTDVQAVFGWDDVTDGQWQFTCVAKDATPNWTGIVPVDNNEAVVTGLTANTEYDFYVRTYCSETSRSDSVKVSFTTLECNPATAITINYILNDDFGDGWNGNAIYVMDGECNILETITLEDGTDTAGSLLFCDVPFVSFVWRMGEYVDETSFILIDGDDVLFVNGEDLDNGEEIYVIDHTTYPRPSDLAAGTPEATSVELSWTENGTATSWTIAYTADGGSPMEVTANTNPFTLTGLTPETTYSAKIQAVNGDNTGLWTCPDITFTTAPSCLIPENVVLTSTTTNQAVFGWDDVTDGQWQFTCVAKNATPNWTGIVPVDNNEAVVTGLTPGTHYDFYVRAYCSETEQSDAEIVSFMTECDPITTFPYTENFDASLYVVPDCWDTIKPNHAYSWGISANESHSGEYSAYSNYYGDTYLIMPAVVLPSDEVKQLKFWSYNSFSDDFEAGYNSVVISTTGKSAADFTTTLWAAESVESEWVADSVSLAAYAGQTVYIAFKYAGDNGNGWYVDDVSIDVIPATATYNITATVNPTDAGTVTGTGEFEYNAETILNATPADGYLFSNWTLNGEVVSTDANLTITVTEDAEYVANFTAMETVETPTFSPESGVYDSENLPTIVINCATAGATIYYTTDGTTPTETSPVYSTPIEITGTTTIKAIATATDMLPSDVAEATYTINQIYYVNIATTIDNGGVTAEPVKGIEGTEITLTATPATGYHFGQWDVVDASNNPVTVTGNTFDMPASDVTVNAIFWIDTLTITATVNPTEAGTVTGAGQFEYNTDVTLTATANEGYLFNNWTLNGESVSSSDILTFTALENAAYVANFVAMGQVAAPTFTPAAGEYDSEHLPEVVISCTTPGATIYYTTDGSAPTTSSNVYSAPILVENTTTIKAYATATDMTPSEVAEATYTINQVYDVYVEETDNGTIGANPSSGVEGTTITLSYTAEDGYTLKKWIVQNGSHEDITVTGNTFNMPASDVYVTAEFVPDTFTVTVVANPTAGGVITSGAGRYAYGEEVSIEFEANPGYEVNHVGMAVESDDEEESDSQFSMPAGNVTVTVYFNPATYSLTIEVGQGRLLNGFVRDNTYTYGEGYNLPGENDVEYAGHTFGGWYGNPDFSGDPITVISTDAYGDSTVYAKWTINTYNITATVNPTNAGMVEGTGEFEYGSDATLVATPLEGFLFENWTLNGEVVSTNAIYDIIGIEADAAFVANFVAMETVSAPVITPDGGTYDSENIPDITVSCETADAIIYYTTDGTDPDENSSVYDGPIIINGTTTVKVLAMAENMLPSEIVTAQFTINQVYYVYVEETDNGTIGAQPSSGVEGTTITLSYTVEDGYIFKKWIVFDNNEEAVTVTGNTFDMPASDVYVSAQFVPDTFTLTIHYMYADNTPAAEDYTEQVAYGDEYSVTSPTVEGHTPSQTVVSGTMPADDYEETVFYSTNSHSLTIHYVYADNSEAHADVVNNYNFGVEYSVESPVIEGYTADITTVSGTMGNDNIEVVVTYTVNSHTLTINYVFEDESEAANTHTETLDYQEEYEVASPELATYMPDQAIVSGTMGDEDVTVTVTYTQIVMDAIDNVVVCNGISTEDITFSTPVTIGSFTYEWANDNAAIGLAETGTEGSIASFEAVNNGTEPAVANVTVTPTCTYNDMVVVGVPQTFTITVNPTLTSEFNATACDSYYWTEADTTITDEGENDYVHVFTSQYDCDSVVTLHLTLHMTPAEIVTNITNNTSCDETQPNGAISIASPAGDFEYSIDNQNWQTETEFTTLAAGDYTLYARPLNSECAQTTTVSITAEIVMPDAAAAFVPGTPSFYCADATIALSGEGSSTGEDYSYAWSGPNNYEGTEMNVTVTTAADGTHSGTYTLVVTNTVTHCSSEATVDVIVNTPTTPDYLFTITTHGDAYANINEGETEVTAVFADPEVHHFLSDCNWTVTNDAQATYNAVGDYTINWTATDDCGNTATTTQTLHVTQNSCGTPIDGDNNSYPTVVMNGTCWMAANLRTTSYTDGRAVPVYYQYQSATAPNATENVDTYGLLYDWYSAMDVARPSKATTVQGACPTGWHIPDDDDFAAISNIDLSALRATDHWLINNADNSTGFTMLPAGQYNADKDRYENLLGNAYFWSATTTNDAEATCHMADCNCSMWYVYPNSKYYGFSVRCVKNN